ncbi:DUF6074 family protein [Bradyrhizobium sp. Cp5.3]|uniref:DUF6074 family protein n=1 Tax=Bradyrhizobium sp. Cp5.3 TaxID=443598 RepID=UPI00041AEFBE|nr:DUF6074 family protein [Bradyrhizobium sp. Cp5.3]
MGDVILFRLVLRSPDEPAAASATELVPFPFSRRRKLVEDHARAMRGLDPERAEAYLTSVLERMCDELNKIGIDCEDCQNEAIFELADAIGKQLHGPHFQLEEAAQ